VIKAAEAKKTSQAYYNKLVSDHAVEYKKIMAREHKETERVWADHGEAVVAQIELAIKKAAAKGLHTTYEPTDVNPSGDEIIYLEDGDRPIHKKLMEYFRQNGFTVEEFQYNGMKISW
jgi:hypothetical protein